MSRITVFLIELEKFSLSPQHLPFSPAFLSSHVHAHHFYWKTCFYELYYQSCYYLFAIIVQH